MIVITKDRGKLKAKSIIFLPHNASHDMFVEWEEGGTEYMRKYEIEAILRTEATKYKELFEKAHDRALRAEAALEKINITNPQ